jgi:hypothetical protein
MTQRLHDALRAEYDLAHDALRPDGVAAVQASATRRRRRQLGAATAALALAMTGGVTAWRLAPGDEPAQVGGLGCDRPGVDVSVFLRVDATDSEIEEVQRMIEGSPEPYCLVFESREAAWERFKQQFRDAPELVAATKIETLPASFRFRVAKASESDKVEPRVRELAGVSDYTCTCQVGHR